MVPVLRDFTINISGLKNGQHTFEFPIENKFFEVFPESPVQKGDLTVSASLDKSDTMLQFHFLIKGTVELECDRSLDLFDLPLDIDEDIIFKYGDEESDKDEIVIIAPDSQQVNLAQIIYELICVNIPMKKLHPRYADDSETDELIYTGQEEDTEEDTDDIDPRWQALKKLKKD